ncbi:ribonuclease H-like [Halyomorpha halys]|uniref:ribonuclease H-like n=1 Tax=Halyomorpha halys TaxID=286706 RepID=UPI0034D1719F
MLHQIDLPTDERQNISISYIPKHDSNEVYGRFKLACCRVKKDWPELEFRAAALKTIYELYPIEQLLHIYTDGSASGINKRAGAGVYSINFQLSFPIGMGCDNYDAEMQAICFAMEATIEYNDNMVIFSDSQAVIQKLTTPDAAEPPTEEKCRNMAAIMKKRGRAIALQWIPGHVGIDGNDQADKLAKLGCAENQPVLPLS